MLFEMLIGKLILGALVGGAVAAAVAISYVALDNWINANSLRGDTVTLTQKEIAGAKQIHIGIFRPAGWSRKDEVASGSLTGDTLDPELARRFNGRTKISYKV